MSEFELCKKCVWPRQCRDFKTCTKKTMLRNQFDAAMSRHNEEELAEYDAKLRALEAE